MRRIIQDNYDTYRDTRLDQRERHFARLAFFLVISAILAVSAVPPLSNMTSLMVTGLAILTGFTFTALFSDHALAEAGLPPPKTETDRHEIKRLEILSRNFRARSEYFIVMSVLCVALLVCIGIDFDIRIPLRWLLSITGLTEHPLLSGARTAYALLSRTIYTIGVFICAFLFLENLYTFYRLTETILAILNARREYLGKKSQK